MGLDVCTSAADGVGQATVQQVAEVGASIIVVGAAIYGEPSPTETAREIRELEEIGV